METPELFMGDYYNGEYLPEKRVSDQKPGGDHFTVDDLFDFPNDDDDAMMTDDFFDSTAANATTDDSATLTSNESCNSSASGNSGYQSLADSPFCGELCVPYDDMAQLEWLSNFVEDSFSTKQNLQTNFYMIPISEPLTFESSFSITHPNSMTQNQDKAIFNHDTPLPGKTRSKRSRAPCDWSKRLLHMTPITKPQPKEQNNFESTQDPERTDRKCLHCATDKTPQWRTGPMGPKTLCNACGVRYKSGRLVPEYRPAASPTFVPTKHSNSHRKVMEIRRQKDLDRAHDQREFLNQNSVFGEDFLIHQHNNPNFRHMI